MQIISLMFSLPKTIYFNFKMLTFKTACKLPILVHWWTKFKSLRGKVQIVSPIRVGMIRIGFGGSGTATFIPTILELNGVCIFDNDIIFGGVTRFPYQKMEC